MLIQKFESLSSDIQDLKTSLGSYTSGKTITGKITPVENQTTPPQTKNVLEQVS